MNIKTVLLSTFFLFNVLFLQAQNAVDTVVTVHEHTKFFGYENYTRLMVINDEFNPNTNSWSVAIDIYGNVSRYRDNDVNILRNTIYFENPYKKQIEKGVWVKGDSVKNGYWIYYEYDQKIREGFVVNGLREQTWIEYDGADKIAEGNYLQGKKDGRWIEWTYIRQETISSEKTGTYKKNLKQGEWIEYFYSKETGKKLPVGRKIVYLNDTLTDNYKKAYLIKYKKDSADCETCNLLGENLIYISLRGRVRARENIGQLLMLFDSLHLDLYSDKVLRTYTDQNGKTKILTVRKHNQFVLSGQWWSGKRGGFDGPVVNKNTLVLEQKHRSINGFQDKILKKLKESPLIVNAIPLCTYTLGPDPLLEAIYVRNLSAEDEAIIEKKMKISPTNSSSSPRDEYTYYDINNLSLEDIKKLLKLLSQSRSVTKISCAQGYIINH